MSFIGKLLRKTEPLTPAVGATAPLDDRVLTQEPDVEQNVADEAPASDSAEQAHSDDAASTPDDQPEPLPVAKVDDDTAWWEEPPPAAAVAASSPTSHSSETKQAEPGSTAELRSAESEPVAQTVELLELEDGTRPLTAA